MTLYISGHPRGRRSAIGDTYFYEFQTEFWLSPVINKNYLLFTNAISEFNNKFKYIFFTGRSQQYK